MCYPAAYCTVDGGHFEVPAKLRSTLPMSANDPWRTPGQRQSRRTALQRQIIHTQIIRFARRRFRGGRSVLVQVNWSVAAIRLLVTRLLIRCYETTHFVCVRLVVGRPLGIHQASIRADARLEALQNGPIPTGS